MSSISSNTIFIRLVTLLSTVLILVVVVGRVTGVVVINEAIAVSLDLFTNTIGI